MNESEKWIDVSMQQYNDYPSDQQGELWTKLFLQKQ